MPGSKNSTGYLTLIKRVNFLQPWQMKTNNQDKKLDY